MRDADLPSIGAFVRAVGDGEAARGSAGEVAALVVGIAVDLSSQVARSSTEWSERGGALAQAETLRDRALALAAEVEHAYRAALQELSRALERSGTTQHSSEPGLGHALEHVVDTLLRLAQNASDVAELAEIAAESGAPVVRADAVAATMLATAAADVCAHLVDVNLLVRPDDERSRLARDLLASAVRSREAALALPR
jgi:formiminotetrahydrofolate cyclodeaminase